MLDFNFLHKILLLISTVLLTACGGATTTATFTTLSVLGNNDGIARGVTSAGTQALVYSPDITGVVA